MLNNVSWIQLIEQFDAKHGNNGIRIDGWVLFADGAQREVGLSGFGQLREPPTDLWERAKLTVMYYEHQLRQLTVEFNDLKQQLRAMAQSHIRQTDVLPPPTQQMEKLRQLQGAVKSCQANLKKARERVEQEKPEQLRRRERMNAEYKQRNEDFIKELEAIKV